jgi:DNA replication initiation complex subunit (GINS family)
MIIANPIYDLTFKKLLENNKAAKFLIGTIIDSEIISLVPTIQEHTYEKDDNKPISLIRKVFAAIIKTKENVEKKVIKI